MQKINPWKVYALYKGDIFLGEGTRRTLAKEFNIKPRTIYFYSTPSYIKRAKSYGKNNFRIVIPIE